MTIDSKNIPKYLFMLGIIIIASFIGKRYTSYFETSDSNNEYKLIQEYLLNESPLYGYNKPKLWIHTNYEYNSRRWKSFQSRSSCDLNQPYIHLTIKSIVLHCADDFNICLIDDDTFSKLIPSWDINMNSLADPLKSRYRKYGLSQLVYFYGGMIVPNTFVCRRNLKDLYIEGVDGGKPFVCEIENRGANSTAGGQESIFNGDPHYIAGSNGIFESRRKDLEHQAHNPMITKKRQQLTFLPNAFFMGARKNDPVMLEMMEYLKIRDTRIHFSSESTLLGNYPQWCLTKVLEGKMNLIDGEMIGTKKMTNKKPILIEDIIEEGFLDIRPDSFGVYIPEEEMLKRNKYQWFAVMSGEEIMHSQMSISKIFVESIVNYLPPNKFVLSESDKVDNIKLNDKTVFTI